MIDIHRMSGSGIDMKEVIPPRSFGYCRWCGAEGVRLQYLMCPNCARIADMIPSKTSVLLNRPEIKKRLRAGNMTLENVVPELRAFLMDPKSRFPPERGNLEHWKQMQEQVISMVSEADINRYYENLLSQKREAEENDEEFGELPSEDELEVMVGLDNLFRYILHIAVLRGLLKLDTDDDVEQSCMVCGRPVGVEGKSICSICRNEIVHDAPEPEIEASPVKTQLGMNTRDIVMAKRNR